MRGEWVRLSGAGRTRNSRGDHVKYAPFALERRCQQVILDAEELRVQVDRLGNFESPQLGFLGRLVERLVDGLLEVTIIGAQLRK
jgi:hypothetical protein